MCGSKTLLHQTWSQGFFPNDVFTLRMYSSHLTYRGFNLKCGNWQLFMKVWLIRALPDNLVTCQSSCHEFRPFLIWQFMLIYHTQFLGVFFSQVTSQCQPLSTVPIFYGKKPWEQGWFILRGHPRGNSKGQLSAKSIRFFEDQVIGNEFLYKW